MQGDLVCRVQRRLGRLRDRMMVRVVAQHLEHLELAVVQVAGAVGHVPEEEAVRDLGRGALLGGPALILGDDHVALRVERDALVAASAERARDVLDRGRVVRGRGIRRRVRTLRRQDQLAGPRIPARAVDRVDRRAARVVGREERHAVSLVGIEVDARDQALLHAPDGSSGLVPLVQEVRAVVVVRVGAVQRVPEREIRVLVRLRLLGLGVPAPGRHHLRLRRVVAADDVVLVPVEADQRGRVLERCRALGDHLGRELDRELRRRCVAGCPRVRGGNAGQVRLVRRRGRGRRSECDDREPSRSGQDQTLAQLSCSSHLPSLDVCAGAVGAARLRR